MTVSGDLPFPFLPPASSVAHLIAGLDWNHTAAGDLKDWPNALKAMTSFILGADFPAAILWGRDGNLIYNDAFIDLVKGRHPAALGQPVRTGWPEIFELNDTVLEIVLSGKTLAYRDRHLFVERGGSRDDAWMNFDFSPLRDDQGIPGGVVVIVKDTTTRIRVEQRLRIAQEAGGVGTFEWYPDSGRLDVSDEYRRIWGIARDVEVTDTLLMSLLHPDDRPHAGFSKRTDDNPLAYAEYRRLDQASGEERWIARRGEVISRPGTATRRFIGIVQDITDRKATETAIRDSEARWRGLFEQMQEAFFIGEAIRGPSGVMHDFLLREINPAFELQSGIAVSDALNRSAREVVPGLPDELVATYAKVVDSGEAASFETFIPTLGDRWFEARARALDRDRFAVLFVDISARKRAERLLRENEARFRSLAQSMPNHVWTATPDGLLDWFNEQVYRYSGYSVGSLDGTGWVAIVHQDDVPPAAETWASARQAGQQYETEFRLRRHDGSYRWHIARAVPIRNTEGQIERWIGTNTDIEAQKAAETALAELAQTLEDRVEARGSELQKTQDALRQSQKMESIGNLTGGVAHDFNNLLQVVSGNLQLLSKEVIGNTKAENRIKSAMEGVSRGSRLASQLLAFGRRQPLAPKVVNLARLIRDMDEMLRRALGEAIDIETIIGGGLWNTLIDPSNVENAILNLAINARDAMDGSGKLTIEAGNAFLDAHYASGHHDVKPGQYVMLAITDTGSGMSPEIIDQVFEPFFSTKPEGKGTGLGLSMVYGFVKQSNGHVKIYSEVGHGTTIKLYLPRSTQSEDVLVNTETGPVIGGHETVLVVEDDQAVRDTVIATLNDLGYRVLQAPDAQSALSVIESGVSIDLLFTDVVMPGPLKSVELVRKAVERLPYLGVLFTSGYTENSIVHAGRLDEGVELLSKPYAREALARKLRHVFANGAQRRLAATALSSKTTHDRADRTVEPGLTILVCEDDVLIRMSTVDMLEAIGHAVINVGDGKSAIRALQHKEIDILLTDVGLPDMSGIALVEQLRSINPTLPVIFATGQSHLDWIAPSPSVGLLNKPYTSEELAKAIADIARAKSAPK